MKCIEAKSLLSPYLDGAVTGRQMSAVQLHLQGCGECRRTYMSMQQVQAVLGKLGRRRAPVDLSLKLRVAVSQEAARSRRPSLYGLTVRLENAMQAFLVPATAGLVTAVVVFGFLIGFLALPSQLQAGAEDVPLMVYSAPQLQQTAFGMSLDNIKDDSLVIEAYVDSNGRIEDYRILSHPQSVKELTSAEKNMLIFTTFRPAMTMGRPTSGRAVLSFSKISVKG
jgi:hypothetical protein